MFVRTALIALIFTAGFSTNADAQLFRFGQNLNNIGRFAFPPQLRSAQPASNFNAETFQYTRQAQRVDFVPSQRLAPQNQAQQQPSCPANQFRGPVTGQELAYRQQVAQQQLAQRQQAAQRQQVQAVQQQLAQRQQIAQRQQVQVVQQQLAAQRQQQIIQQQLAQRQQVAQRQQIAQQQLAQRQLSVQPQQLVQPQRLVQRQPLIANQPTTIQQYQTRVLTYRDDRTGRTFQRRYLVQGQPQPQIIQRSPVVALSTLPQLQTTTSSTILPQAPPAAVASSTVENSNDVRQTSFEAPLLTPQTESDEVSVFQNDDDTGIDASIGDAKSVVESSLPTLDLPELPTSTDPGSLDFDTGETLDIDLPALDADGN